MRQHKSPGAREIHARCSAVSTKVRQFSRRRRLGGQVRSGVGRRNQSRLALAENTVTAFTTRVRRPISRRSRVWNFRNFLLFLLQIKKYYPESPRPSPRSSRCTSCQASSEAFLCRLISRIGSLVPRIMWVRDADRLETFNHDTAVRVTFCPRTQRVFMISFSLAAVLALERLSYVETSR